MRAAPSTSASRLLSVALPPGNLVQMADSSPNELPPPPLSVETLASYKNEIVPSNEALIARPWLLGAEAELERIDEEIQRLEARRNGLRAPIQAYRIALAPHKVLPDDVLREIFVWATLERYFREPPTADLNSTLSGRPNVRLVIGRVSSHWRAVSLDIPELWSDVRVEIPWGQEAFKSRLLNMLDLWLARSGHHPVSLDIRSASDPCVPPLLMRYSHRIRCLSIDCLEPLVGLAGSMDILERFDVQGRHASILDDSISVLQGSHRLRSVTLCSVSDGYPVILKPLGIPWSQLTELHLENITVGVLQSYHILEQCTALTCARLDIFESFSKPFPTIDRQIALPGLRALGLDGNTLRNFAKFLDSLTLPSLVELSLYGPDGLMYELDESNPEHTTMYPIGTFPAVRQLAVHHAFYTDDTEPHPLVPWFHACPSAVDVWLPGYTMPNPLLNQIAEGSLLPNLEILSIDSAEGPTLIAALQARQRSLHHSTITEVALASTALWTTHEQEALAQLMTLGVFLSGYPDPYGHKRAERGEIKEQARFYLENHLGLFRCETPPSEAAEGSSRNSV
ncbi:hypothetical protein FB451DRAFT_368851 [Mycena latifolia]|nr:hypothetical protein FB451DRAFT_368851 [Mycena latifolia]